MQGKITASKLNVRNRPSMDSIVVGALTRDTLVDIDAEVRNWYAIEYRQQAAFIHSDFVDVVQKTVPQKGIVTTSLLNVRSLPSLSGEVLATVAQTTVLDIVSELENWLKVDFDGRIAYVARDYVQRIERFKPQTGQVTADILNVRRQPELDAEKVGSLQTGTKISVVDRFGDWLSITFNDTTAYVHADFVELHDVDDLAEPGYSQPSTIAIRPDKQIRATGGNRAERQVIGTWNQYGNLLHRLSDTKSISPASAVAVLCVESGGRGFAGERQIIRFENHHFWRYWGKKHAEVFERHFRFDDARSWKGHEFRKSGKGPWQKFHGNQDKEWHVLEFARSLDDTAALLSISMGASQIMGSNHKRIGFRTVQEMFEQFSTDVRFHIIGLFDFFDKNMVRALRNQDFVSFASGYNGQGQAETYGSWIKDHYHAFVDLDREHKLTA